MIIIGSSAIKYHFPDFPREPKDLDVIEPCNIFYEGPLRVEVLKNEILNKWHDYTTPYLSPDYLFTLKVSHTAGFDINWEKHVWDIQWLKVKGCKLNDELFYKLYEYWKEIHGKPKKSNLNLKTEDFFDNAIKYPIEHDDIHKILNVSPSYLKIKEDNITVLTSEKLWNELSFEEQCDIIREETMVMAIERYDKLDYRIAYIKMLKKLIINHLPVWQAKFAVQYHKELITPKYNFINKINEFRKTNNI